MAWSINGFRNFQVGRGSIGDPGNSLNQIKASGNSCEARANPGVLKWDGQAFAPQWPVSGAIGLSADLTYGGNYVVFAG